MIWPMTASDIPRVAEICVFGWRSTYKGIFSDEYLFRDLTVAKKAAEIEKKYIQKANETFIFDDGILKAYIIMVKSGDKPDTLELGELYVDSAFQMQGIGTQLLHFFEKKAAERGFKEIILWTFEKNAAARAFYGKHGYEPDGTRQVYEPHEVEGVRYSKQL